MYCSSCAVECDQNYKFCPSCGSIISSTGIVFEVHISKLSQASVVWAISIFSLIGLIISLGMVFAALAYRHERGIPEFFLKVSVVCLIFIFLISLLLIWRFGGTAKLMPDAIKQILRNGEKRNRLTINEDKRVKITKEEPVVPEPLSSVTEQTTQSPPMASS